MSHFGIPGPGGSMGKCAVCGDDFSAGVIMDLCGMDSGITSFNVGFTKQTLYAHDPKCVDAVKQAFQGDDPEVVCEQLPEGPLKKCLRDAVTQRLNQEGT